jgi:hypothetical protein
MGLLLLILALWLIAAVVSAIARWRPQPVRPPVVAPVRRAVRADVPHALYDYLLPAGLVRYTGISNEPPARDRRHAKDPDDQWWYQGTTKVMYVIGWYPNRDAALAAERIRVRTLALAGHPLANDHHNPVRRPRRVA